MLIKKEKQKIEKGRCECCATIESSSFGGRRLIEPVQEDNEGTSRTEEVGAAFRSALQTCRHVNKEITSNCGRFLLFPRICVCVNLCVSWNTHTGRCCCRPRRQRDVNYRLHCFRPFLKTKMARLHCLFKCTTFSQTSELNLRDKISFELNTSSTMIHWTSTRCQRYTPRLLVTYSKLAPVTVWSDWRIGATHLASPS